MPLAVSPPGAPAELPAGPEPGSAAAKPCGWTVAAAGAVLVTGPDGEPAPSPEESSVTMLSCPDLSDSMASCSKGRLAPAPADALRLTVFPFALL